MFCLQREAGLAQQAVSRQLAAGRQRLGQRHSHPAQLADVKLALGECDYGAGVGRLTVEAVEKPIFGGILDKEMARIFAPFCFCPLIDLVLSELF